MFRGFTRLLRMPGAHLLGLVLLVGLLLLPGLRGLFVFDDFGNLQGLASISRTSDVLTFIFDSTSGPFGRPVAMATFWLQSGCWPQSPWCFKAINLGLHLFNGALLYGVITSLAAIADRKDARILALIVAALWLLHPIHASTVFYVVQRMNLLAATFTLLGLLAYFGARHANMHHDCKRSVLYGWLLFPLALLLAALSKENGLLLVAFVAAVEFALPPSAQSRAHTAWRTTFIAAPIVLALIGLLIYWNDFVLRGYAARPFTFEERLLTQARILIDYLHAIIAPSGTRIGLFRENYTLSTGLLQPATTLVSITFLAITTTLAIRFRRNAPLLALGWLWFLAGHAMESSVFPLEIYFEHRNYLPAAGILVALVVSFMFMLKHVRDARLRCVTLAAFALYGLFFSWVAHQEARIWGDPIRQSVIWASENPDSPRIQIYLNTMLRMLGKEDEAVRHFEDLAERLDDPLIPWMTWLEARCAHPQLKEPPYARMKRALESTPLSIRPTNAINQIVRNKLDGSCPAVSPEVLRRFNAALLRNPAFAPRRYSLNLTMALIDVLDKDYDSAVDRLLLLYRESPSPELALHIAVRYLESGRPEDAAAWIDQARANHARHPARSSGFVQDADFLEGVVQDLLKEQE